MLHQMSQPEAPSFPFRQDPPLLLFEVHESPLQGSVCLAGQQVPRPSPCGPGTLEGKADGLCVGLRVGTRAKGAWMPAVCVRLQVCAHTYIHARVYTHMCTHSDRCAHVVFPMTMSLTEGLPAPGKVGCRAAEGGLWVCLQLPWGDGTAGSLTQ